jgi:hypothetical protein
MNVNNLWSYFCCQKIGKLVEFTEQMAVYVEDTCQKKVNEWNENSKEFGRVSLMCLSNWNMCSGIEAGR